MPVELDRFQHHCHIEEITLIVSSETLLHLADRYSLGLQPVTPRRGLEPLSDEFPNVTQVICLPDIDLEKLSTPSSSRERMR